ncbi:hypothetical protein Tco_1097144 [Tanacetum coccineum]
MQFLMGLDDVYQPIRSSILTREPLPDVKTAFSLISRKESHRGSSSGSVGTKVLVFAAKSPDNNTYNKKKQNKNSNEICTNPSYGLPGHSIEKCYKIFGYPDHIKKKWANTQRTSDNFSRNNITSSSIEVPTS